MDVELELEHRMLADLVRRFVEEELIPREPAVLRRESEGRGIALEGEDLAAVNARARELGLWGLDIPAEFGGAELPAVAMIGPFEAIGRTIVHYAIPPDSPNLHMLAAVANEEQRRRYLEPHARGETISAIAISEPGAGSDPAAMTTRAVRDGGDWVLNGRKIWISKAAEADFTIVMALTDQTKGARGGISAFIVDRGTPGFHVSPPVPMLGGRFTHEIALEDCRIPARCLLGEEGKGFAPMQKRLSIRRLQMGAWCVGMAERALEIMTGHAGQRSTFGSLLARRQAVQWWIADAATRIHASRLMVYDAARKVDRGQDVRTELSMIKVFVPEMASEVVDHAMQTLGALGVSKEMPLHLMAAKLRWIRIGEGPSEIHRWVVARGLLGEAASERG
ncbi:MAG: acyl-CoA dehydrogenase family protein [Alphaproteobacteria bacterium]|nr:acyl-CoA dehydrogenase family protein [Alphaproteobacteria bacterium]